MATDINRALGLFSSRQDAEQVLLQLRDNSFDMDKVSVITRDPQTDKIQGATVNSEAEHQIPEAKGTAATVGSIGGGTVGLISGLGVLAIPGVGSIAEIGVLLANTLLGSGIGAAGGGIVGALIDWGLPEGRAKFHKNRTHNENDYLIVVEGSPVELETTQALVKKYRFTDWQAFSAPAVARSPLAGEQEMLPTCNRTVT